MRPVRRVIAISDLHIGGHKHPMLGAPDLLAGFLGQLADHKPALGEQVELVIHGDFIDFLAEEPNDAWTASEAVALAKLEQVFRRHPGLFDALAKCVGAMSRFTLLLGNHDIELAYPQVRDALLARLGTEQHRCLFIGDNQGYRVGDLLIEHGNRYDPWNAIDYDGLRETASAASRGEAPPRALAICPGSRFVHDVMNPLKDRYQFIDLLKPETELVALLLTTFEPELKRDLSLIYGLASSYAKQYYRKASWTIAGPRQGLGQATLVARGAADDLPADVRAAFADERSAADGRQLVSVGQTLRRLFLKDPSKSIKTKLEKGEDVDPKRLQKLQVALRAKLAADRSFEEGDDAGECAEAARGMIEAKVARVVVMGHTHLRRDVPFGEGRYLNTGTWADLIRVKKSDPFLQDSEAGRAALLAWLRRLVTNDLEGIRLPDPTYADVRVADGHVIFDDRPMLRRFGPGEPFA